MKKISWTILLLVFVTTNVNARSWRNDSDHYSPGGDEKKICSAVVPGVFRDSIVVNDGWGLRTCSQYAKSVGGSHFQLGCMTSNGLKWSKLVDRKRGRRTRVGDLRNIRSCHWRNGQRYGSDVNNASDGVKICSAILPGVFRDTIRIDKKWSIRSCQKFAQSIGASNFQLGCMQNEGFNWGKMTVTTARRRDRRISARGTGCGWER